MEKQIALSIEQMKHLKELGCDTSLASMHYTYMPTADSIINGTEEVEVEPDLFTNCPNMKHEHPAFTLQDILEVLENARYDSFGFPMIMLDYNIMNGFWYITLRNVDGFEAPSYKEKSVLDASYEMLCWCAENGFLKKGE